MSIKWALNQLMLKRWVEKYQRRVRCCSPWCGRPWTSVRWESGGRVRRRDRRRSYWPRAEEAWPPSEPNRKRPETSWNPARWTFPAPAPSACWWLNRSTNSQVFNESIHPNQLNIQIIIQFNQQNKLTIIKLINSF